LSDLRIRELERRARLGDSTALELLQGAEGRTAELNWATEEIRALQADETPRTSWIYWCRWHWALQAFLKHYPTEPSTAVSVSPVVIQYANSPPFWEPDVKL